MDKPILNREQSRMVDKIAIEEFGISGVVLMENAGRNVAELLLRRSPTGRVTILCGKGNNGGDGFVIARHLDNQQIPVSIILIDAPEELAGDAATNFRIIQKSGLPFHQLSLPGDIEMLREALAQSDWVVDALLGTGVQGKAREPHLSVINLVNESQRKVLSVDVPSGLDSDSGPVADATIRATVTATFVALKQGLTTANIAKYAGRIEVIDIGAPRVIFSKIFS